MASQTYDLLKLFTYFIRDSRTGKRKQLNGTKITPQSVENYTYTLKLLQEFNSKLTEPLRIRHLAKLGKREHNKERLYWAKFNQDFSSFLYGHGLLDNTVGLHFKNIKAFFKYLQLHRSIETGAYFKQLTVVKEEIPVVVLTPERVRFLIYDADFRNGLPNYLECTLDRFILGCTSGLRFSDLALLRKSNLETSDNSSYLVTRSLKTKTNSRVKLPPYAVDIINKYRNKQVTLLPKISLNQFNSNLKQLFERAGWTEEVGKIRSKNGIGKQQKNTKGKPYRFCDLASSHLMRKTAITTMLMLGMPEPLVRKISGHAPNSKEFYKYVKYSQGFVDEHTDLVFEKLAQVGKF